MLKKIEKELQNDFNFRYLIKLRLIFLFISIIYSIFYFIIFINLNFIKFKMTLQLFFWFHFFGLIGWIPFFIYYLFITNEQKFIEIISIFFLPTCSQLFLIIFVLF